ncbi:MAG: sensor histidine kinase [Longimicrobiales bacterium]
MSDPQPSATVLIVDDEAIVRETLSDLLEAERYRVVCVARGEEVFDHLDAVDLVLLDGMLPGRDGWEICAAIKERVPLLPVLMVTARTSPEDVIKTFRAGADDYIAKPFNVAELTARIRTRLRAHRTELALQDANRRFRKLAEQNYALYEQARRDADERAALLRELDHRVRNNLSVVLGLVTMERNRRPRREPAAALRSLELRMRAFMLVHDAFRGDSFRSIPVRPLIDRLAQRLSTVFDPARRITLELDAEPIQLNERQGLALALVLNELITNCYEHGFPATEDGTIRVSCRQEGDAVEVRIEDSGIGMDSANEPAPIGSGRSLIETLTRAELGGDVGYDVNGRAGTRVRLRFTRAEIPSVESDPSTVSS